MTWLMWTGVVVGVLTIAAVALRVVGAMLWADLMRTHTDLLEAARVDGTRRVPSITASSARFDPRELEGLPTPVQRYFRAVLKDGQPIIAAATIELALIAKLLGLFTVADAHGGGEMARGEFMRYFAEAAWYPTALLPSQGVWWAAVDGNSATATIVDGPITLTLLFRFNKAGLIASVRAESRGAGVGKDMVMLPWDCSLADYRRQHGMLLPMTGEAAWVRREGRKAYFFGKVTSLRYEFLP